MSTDRRKVLLICYYFPPLGGAGIGRPLSLFKELGDYGYDCDLLTVKPVTYRMYEPELLNQIDTKRVHRAGSIDPQRLLYLFGFRKINPKQADESREISKSFFPDSKIGWVKPAVRKGQKLIEKNRYDLLLSTSPPVSVHLVAKELADKNKIPWVADWRDYWTAFKPEDQFDDKSKIEKCKKLSSDINLKAGAVTAVNQSVADYVHAESVISNSYDKIDAALWSEPESSDKFVIGLFGTFSDLNPVEPLFKLLNQLRQKYPRLFEKIRLLQVGQVELRWFNSQLDKYSLKEITETKGYLTTGRIFTLLASGRPLLAFASKESELANLLKQAPNSCTFDDDSLNSAVDFVGQTIERIESKELKITPQPDYARKYSSANMTKQFAELFDRVLKT
jgi:glycosyltransferase involved in cell wall biosynthesis